MVAGAALCTIVAAAGHAGAAEVCQTYRWNGNGTKLSASGAHTVATGITLAPGRIASMTYSSADSYPGRRLSAQPYEVWGVTVGGVAVGGLTSDVPDPTDADQATVSGSLSGGPTSGGAVLIMHASEFGVGSGENSVTPVSLTIVHCVVEPDPEPAPTVPIAPTDPPTTTNLRSPTTPTVLANPPTLPATGSTRSRAVVLGGFSALLVGSLCGLASRRRRPAL
jgi:LPXTG-motif cell wall-anchored protein